MFMPSSLSFCDSLFHLCTPPIFPSPLRRTTTLLFLTLHVCPWTRSFQFLSYHALPCFTPSVVYSSPNPPLCLQTCSHLPRLKRIFVGQLHSLITALPVKVFPHHLYSITDSHINTPGWGSCPQHFAEIYSNLKIMERKKLVAWNFFLVLSPQPFRILWSIWQLILIFILSRWNSYKINQFSLNISVAFTIFRMLYNHHLWFQDILLPAAPCEKKKEAFILSKHLIPPVHGKKLVCILFLGIYSFRIFHINIII